MTEEVDALLEDLKEMTKNYKGLYDKTKNASHQRIREYRNVLKSKASSNEAKAIAVLAIQGDYHSLANISSEISVLYTLQRLVLHLGILKASIDSLNGRLTQSGILEKAKDIDDIKKFKEILKSIIEKKKIAQEKLRKDLSYID